MIHYRKGYDYVLDKQAFFVTDIKPEKDIVTDFITLDSAGCLTIRNEYAWNGGTGAVDDKAMIYASLAHDALYQLIGEGLLPDTYREQADLVLDGCLQYAYQKQKGFAAATRRITGFASARRWWVLKAVRELGGHFAHKQKEVFTAP